MGKAVAAGVAAGPHAASSARHLSSSVRVTRRGLPTKTSAAFAVVITTVVARSSLLAIPWTRSPKLYPAAQWERFGDMNAAELAATLRQMARAIDLRRYRKATRGPKKPVARKVYRNGGHVSTHKVLQEREQ